MSKKICYPLPSSKSPIKIVYKNFTLFRQILNSKMEIIEITDPIPPSNKVEF